MGFFKRLLGGSEPPPPVSRPASAPAPAPTEPPAVRPEPARPPLTLKSNIVITDRSSMATMMSAALKSFQQDDYHKAADLFCALSIADPTEPGFAIYLGIATYKREYGRIESFSDSGRPVPPETAHQTMKGLDEASDLLRRGIDIAKNASPNVAKDEGIRPIAANAWDALGACQMILGQLRRDAAALANAVDAYGHAVQLKPGDEDARAELRKCEMFLAALQMQRR